MGQDRDDAWSEAMGRRIAQAIRTHRAEQGLSTDALAKRCAALGWSVSRSKIANLENGSRSNVTLEELLVISAALGVPPALLLFPQLGDHVNALPGHSMLGIHAVDWVSGHRLPESLDIDGARSRYGEATAPLRARQTHHELQWNLLLADDDRDSDAGRTRFRRAVLELAEHENVMAANGWPIVPLEEGFPEHLTRVVARVRAQHSGVDLTSAATRRAAAEIIHDTTEGDT